MSFYLIYVTVALNVAVCNSPFFKLSEITLKVGPMSHAIMNRLFARSRGDLGCALVRTF